MARSLKRQEPAPIDPYRAQPLPLDRLIAVYYRQSSEGQIGNVSTTLQTVDMVVHLERLGWLEERIKMIDMDAGVSGTKKMHERKGMSELWRLIENAQVGAVAAQDVDRFFRDMTQIEPNLFIDACKRNNILVLTPTMVYDFGHLDARPLPHAAVPRRSAARRRLPRISDQGSVGESTALSQRTWVMGRP